LPEQFDQDAASSRLVIFTSGVQAQAQISGTLPRPNQFRIERVVEYPGQHLLLFASHVLVVSQASMCATNRQTVMTISASWSLRVMSVPGRVASFPSVKRFQLESRFLPSGPLSGRVTVIRK